MYWARVLSAHAVTAARWKRYSEKQDYTLNIVFNLNFRALERYFKSFQATSTGNVEQSRLHWIIKHGSEPSRMLRPASQI
jgi:hypothetical protein